jgi:3-dehydroquinate synthase
MPADNNSKNQALNDVSIVNVDLADRSYDIVIGHGILEDLRAHLPVEVSGRPIFVVADESVGSIYAQKLREALIALGASQVHAYQVPDGESSKSMAAFEKVMSWMLDHGVDRSAMLFALGGGVVGDLGGFAAASILRGIDFVQVPTSLLAQVDSAVGGKTGINMKQGKNLVGAFYQPKAVITDTQTLDTLPDREMKAGYAEILKYALINDKAFFEWLCENGHSLLARDPAALKYAIKTACDKKAAIVKADEREGGVRALLNLGHTFAHSLEKAAGYDGSLKHGEAVAIGLVLAFRVSVQAGFCHEDELKRVEAHMREIGLPTEIAMITPAIKDNEDQLLAYMGHDKKVAGGKLVFILATEIGKAFVTSDIDINIIKDVLHRSIHAKKHKKL